VYFSVSTWQQPMPPACSAARAAVLDGITNRILAFGPRRLRVAVDGLTAAGKTTLAHELAQRVADTGRVVARASLDDFKRPWSESHLYDRMTGEGYYRNAFDVDATRQLLLDPAAPNGSGRVALCSIDPLTQVNHSKTRVDMPADGVLIVDGVFAFRPPLDSCWDLRIWLHIDPELSIRRGIARDAQMEGAGRAEMLHRDRYLAAETLYIAEHDPTSRADVVIDNSDFDRPVGQPVVR
jgi:uridine kinase